MGDLLASAVLGVAASGVLGRGCVLLAGVKWCCSCGFLWAACFVRYCLQAPAMGRSLRKREQQPAPLPHALRPLSAPTDLSACHCAVLLQQAAGPRVADDERRELPEERRVSVCGSGKLVKELIRECVWHWEPRK